MKMRLMLFHVVFINFIGFRRGDREAEGDGLLIRCTCLNMYRGFESLPLRNNVLIMRP